MDFERFVNVLAESVCPGVVECSDYYWEGIKKGRRIEYQYAKVIEEVGELLAAIAAENSCHDIEWSTHSYESVRGTIESEAADVLLASMAFIRARGSSVLYMKGRTPSPILDEHLFMTRMLRSIDLADTTLAIETLYSYFDGRHGELLKHVILRLQFNLERIKAEKKDERQRRKTEGVRGARKQGSRSEVCNN